MNFKPSDKVVALETWMHEAIADAGASIISGELPERGKVYVVREVAYCPVHKTEILHFVGIELSLTSNGKEFGFVHIYFRKLEEIQAEARAKHEEEAALKEAIELINLY